MTVLLSSIMRQGKLKGDLILQFLQREPIWKNPRHQKQKQGVNLQLRALIPQETPLCLVTGIRFTRIRTINVKTLGKRSAPSTYKICMQLLH